MDFYLARQIIEIFIFYVNCKKNSQYFLQFSFSTFFMQFTFTYMNQPLMQIRLMNLYDFGQSFFLFGARNN